MHEQWSLHGTPTHAKPRSDHAGEHGHQRVDFEHSRVPLDVPLKEGVLSQSRCGHSVLVEPREEGSTEEAKSEGEGKEAGSDGPEDFGKRGEERVSKG